MQEPEYRELLRDYRTLKAGFRIQGLGYSGSGWLPVFCRRSTGQTLHVRDDDSYRFRVVPGQDQEMRDRIDFGGGMWDTTGFVRKQMKKPRIARKGKRAV